MLNRAQKQHLSLSDEERDALLSVFESPSETPLDNQNLMGKITPYYIALLSVLILLFTYIQLIKPSAIEHYSLIHQISALEAKMLLKSKAIITLIGVSLLTITYVIGRGVTMMSIIFLLILTNGFIDDFTARLATQNSLSEMPMNVITVFRIALIGIVSRIAYICIMRTHIKE